jgi:hypothetical protein
LEGNELRVTGIASNAKSKEEGRQTAFENGMQEIKNFFATIGGQLPEVETQMTYEEPNRDGSVNVYRLLKVDLSGIEHKTFENKFTSRLGHEGGEAGSLRVVTVPPGAEIYLASDYVGKSNAQLSNVGEGSYEVLLKLQDYVPKTVSVTVSRGQSTIVQETLNPKEGALAISGTQGALASIEGIGKTTIPGRIGGLVVGKNYSIHIAKEGYLPQDRSIAIVDDFERSLNVVLDPLPAELSVLSDPDGADVLLNGASVGKTPLRSYKVQPGDVEVQIFLDGYIPQEINTSVEAEEKKLLPIFKLAPLSEQLKAEEEKSERQQNPAWRLYLGFGWSGAPLSVGCSNQTGQGNAYCEFFDVGFQRQIFSFLGVRIDYRRYLDGISNPQTATPTVEPDGVYSFSSNELTFRAPIYLASIFYLAPETGLSEGTVSVTGGNSTSVEQHFVGGAAGVEGQLHKALGGYFDVDYRHYSDAGGYSGKGSFQGSFGLRLGF